MLNIKEKIDGKNSAQVVVVGGGTAGISVIAQLKRKGIKDVILVEPSNYHYYQPGYTLVSGGIMNRNYTRREMSSVVPSGTHWIKDSVVSFDPKNNQINTATSGKINYDYLVVASGIQINWDDIKGLKNSLGTYGVCSIYSFETVDYARKAISEFEGGKAVFTQPPQPIKCAGAPQKVMYLADDIWTKKGLKTTISFFSALGSIFGCSYYAPKLAEICASRNLNTNFGQDLVEVKAPQKIAVFKDLKSGKTQEVAFDLLHVTPKMGAPTFIKNSPLANEAGFVNVDKETLISPVYSNVFSLGDCSSLPTSKTAAAISSQAPILVNNLINSIDGKTEMAKYDGYTSCPIPTRTGSLINPGKLVFCEFNYKGEPQESFFWDQREESKLGFLVKSQLIPMIYWNGTLKGYFRGPKNHFTWISNLKSSTKRE